jgi:hypothetical protein
VTAARNEPPVTLRRLLPSIGSVTADEAVAELDFASAAPADRPFVAVNMVATPCSSAQARCAPSATAG